MKLVKLLILIFFVSGFLATKGQNINRRVIKKNPPTFSISKVEFDQLFSCKKDEVVNCKTNLYLNKSNLVISISNGDMKFLKLKLSYFPNAFLMVQVSGKYSTQVFVTSDDKSVFYKGRFSDNHFIMTKCNEDDIVSE